MRNPLYKLNSLILICTVLFYSCGSDDPSEDITEDEKAEQGVPVINSITPTEAYVTDTITISGENFSNDKTKLEVSFSGTLGDIISATLTEIKVIVPLELSTTQPTVFVNKDSLSTYVGNMLTILKPSFSVYRMSPMKGSPGQIIQVEGTGLPTAKEDIEVFFNGTIPATVTYASSTSFKVVAPQHIETGYFKITINDRSLPSPTSFSVISGGIWEPISMYEGSLQNSESLDGFTIGDDIYVGFSIINWWDGDMWKYNTTGNTWTQLNDFPGSPRKDPFTFSFGNKAYIGTGLMSYDNFASDVWKYDAELDQWMELPAFPGGERYSPISFSVNGKGYVGGGTLYGSGSFSDFWEFDPTTESWTQLTDFPGGDLTDAAVFVIGTDAYVAGGFTNDYRSELWKFDALTKTWTQKASLPKPRRSLTAFALEGKGVITGGYNFEDDWFRDTWVYDPSSDTWTQHANFYGYAVNNPYSSSVGEHGYVIGGQGNPEGIVYRFSF